MWSTTIPINSVPYSDLPSTHSKLFEAKACKSIGKDEVWVAAAFYGQTKFTGEELAALATALDIPTGELQAGLGDHCMGVLVYGHTIKAVIHEKFGDGIMSMIDCTINIARKPDPKGDRVLLTFDGKFMLYAKW
ncbi:cyanate lyase C-terminal domain-containing protein [Mycena rosella]|uniref:Cyanate lyase C-terminal domain-containing protein n=1 Tax=Mycena rosella TaxID=1033263 RepID=A0AAD7CRS7_MYCRO|nr:cyanate lyase C-terminal domain-containing protein [Mycena rosella]